MAERLGPSLNHWLEQPYAFALWSWHQLQELDRVRRWHARGDRITAAELNGIAFNDPKRLADERQSLLAEARGTSAVAESATRGQTLARRITRALSRG